MRPADRRPPRFRPGDRVVVQQRETSRHVRTPGYVQGKPGVVVGYGGVWGNPELLAYGRDDPDGVGLYRIHFEQHVLWDDYAGRAGDRVSMDLYEHWLDPEVTS